MAINPANNADGGILPTQLFFFHFVPIQPISNIKNRCNHRKGKLLNLLTLTDSTVRKMKRGEACKIAVVQMNVRIMIVRIGLHVSRVGFTDPMPKIFVTGK